MNIIAAEGLVLPEKSKGSLVSMVVAKELEAAEHTKDCQKLIKLAKPWADNDMTPFSPTNQSTWVLAAPNITEDEKVQWFQEAIFTNYLWPMIEDGESRAAAVGRFCAAMLAAWEADVQSTEVSDDMLSSLEVILRAWRTLELLVRFDLNSLFDDVVWDNLEYMKKLTATTNNDPEVLVALSVSDAEFYNSRLQRLLAIKTFMLEHSAAIEDDVAFFEELQEDFTIAKAQEVKPALARLCVYQKELPGELLKPLVAKACSRVSIFVTDGAKKSAEDRVAYPSTCLADLSAEMSICFAFDAGVDELVARVGELSASSASESIEKAAITILEQIAAEKATRLPKELLDKLMPFTIQGQLDLKLTATHAPLVLRAIAALGEMLRQDIAEPSEQGPMELDAMKVIAAWVGIDDDAAVLTRAWLCAKDLAQAFMDFDRLGQDLLTRIEADMELSKDDNRLATCRRSLSAAQAHVDMPLIEKLDAKLAELLKKEINQTVALVKEVGGVRMEQATKNVDEAELVLKQVAGGMRDCTSWTVGLLGGMNYETLKAHYDKTLGVLGENEISDPLAKLNEAGFPN